MRLDPSRTVVLGLHWTVNVIKPEGFFASMLSEPVARSGVVPRAVHMHSAAREAGVPIVYTRFTVPTDGGQLVRNTQLVSAVADTPEMFRPDAPGNAIIPELLPLSDGDQIVDNQKVSGLAGNDLAERLTEQGIDTLLLTGVATNLTVEQTARHATDLGFFVHVISDCVTAADDNAHAAALANFKLGTAGSLSSAEAIERLRPAGR